MITLKAACIIDMQHMQNGKVTNDLTLIHPCAETIAELQGFLEGMAIDHLTLIDCDSGMRLRSSMRHRIAVARVSKLDTVVDVWRVKLVRTDA